MTLYNKIKVAGNEKLLEKIGKRIKELRINKLKMTQEEFANILGVDRSYLSRVESGKQNITMRMLGFICLKLDISPCEFFAIFKEKENDTINKMDN